MLALHPSVAKDTESWVTQIPVLSPGPYSSRPCKGEDHSLQRDYFRRPGRSTLCKAVRREGRITSATASLAQGTIGSTAVLFGKVREEKKVLRELSWVDGTIGDSRIMLHIVISFS